MFKSTRSAMNSNPITHINYERLIYSEYGGCSPEDTPPPLYELQQFSLADQPSPSLLIPLEVAPSRCSNELDKGSAATQCFSPLKPQQQDDILSEGLAEDCFPSGEQRVRAIRQVLLSLAVQVVCCSLWTAVLLVDPKQVSPLTKAAAVVAVVGSWTAYWRLQSSISAPARLLVFCSFNAGLPYSLTVLGDFFNPEDLSHGLFQLCAVMFGLCLYAWTSSYELWNSSEERLYAVVPNLFASAILGLLVSDRLLPVVVSGVLVWLIGALVSDCSKDVLIPASSVDQRLADILGVYLSIFSQASFKMRRRLGKVWHQPDLF